MRTLTVLMVIAVTLSAGKACGHMWYVERDGGHLDAGEHCFTSAAFAEADDLQEQTLIGGVGLGVFEVDADTDDGGEVVCGGAGLCVGIAAEA